MVVSVAEESFMRTYPYGWPALSAVLASSCVCIGGTRPRFTRAGSHEVFGLDWAFCISIKHIQLLLLCMTSPLGGFKLQEHSSQLNC